MPTASHARSGSGRRRASPPPCPSAVHSLSSTGPGKLPVGGRRTLDARSRPSSGIVGREQSIFPKTPPGRGCDGWRPCAQRGAAGRKTGKSQAQWPANQCVPPLARRDVGGNTPLKIPYGNKEVALKLGARYATGGWYAPPGVDLSAFSRKGLAGTLAAACVFRVAGRCLSPPGIDALPTA